MSPVISAPLIKKINFLSQIFVLILLVSCNHSTPYSQTNSKLLSAPKCEALEHRLMLIGDTGAPIEGGEPALKSLEHFASLCAKQTTVVFLGDIIYENGMVGKNEDAKQYKNSKKRIDEQLALLGNGNIQGVFIPGNHDWAQGEKGGLQRVLNLESYLKTNEKNSAHHSHQRQDAQDRNPFHLDRIKRSF